MSLKERLLQDMKAAMIDKDKIKKDTIQMARAAVLQVEKDNRITLNDDDIIDVISKEVKKRKAALTEFEKSDRQDLIDNLKREIEVLKVYMPEQMSIEELTSIVSKAVAETGAETVRDMGRVMKVVMPKTKGRADGKTINEIAKKLLG